MSHWILQHLVCSNDRFSRQKSVRICLVSVCYNLFQKIEAERILCNSFLKKTIITLISKPDKDIIRLENYRALSLMNIKQKSSTKYQQIKFSHVYKVLDTTTKWDKQHYFNIENSISTIHYINRLGRKIILVYQLTWKKHQQMLDKIDYAFLKRKKKLAN